ncbi:MAG: hypothetical protein ACOC8K_05245 [Gemmatimonadota bacterium]
MTPHGVLVWLPAPLLLLALLFDVLALSGRGEAGVGPWGRRLVAAALGVLALAAFTGFGARRTLPASVPGSPMPPWDVHVNFAVILVIVILGVGVVRIRAVGGRWKESPHRVVLLDLVLLLLVSAVMVTGLRIP